MNEEVKVPRNDMWLAFYILTSIPLVVFTIWWFCIRTNPEKYAANINYYYFMIICLTGLLFSFFFVRLFYQHFIRILIFIVVCIIIFLAYCVIYDKTVPEVFMGIINSIRNKGGQA